MFGRLKYTDIGIVADEYPGRREWLIQYYRPEMGSRRARWQFSQYNGGYKSQRRHTLEWCIDQIKLLREVNVFSSEMTYRLKSGHTP